MIRLNSKAMPLHLKTKYLKLRTVHTNHTIILHILPFIYNCIIVTKKQWYKIIYHNSISLDRNRKMSIGQIALIKASYKLANNGNNQISTYKAPFRTRGPPKALI